MGSLGMTSDIRHYGSGTGRIVRAIARTATEEGSEVQVLSGSTDVELELVFEIDPALPTPGLPWVCQMPTG